MHFIVALIMTLIGFASLPAAAQSGRIFYIDYASGSNTNNGTSKNTPWKTHPYMQTGASCTGTGSAPSYTHAAGDQFIFKGGVTWPAACFGMNVTSGGSSASLTDYYGVDKTWYAGGSWAMPIFDLAGQAPTSVGPSGAYNVIYVSRSASYTVWDALEMKGQFVVGGHSGPSDGWDCGIYFSVAGTSTVKNGYFHDWVTDTANLNAGFSNCAGGISRALLVTGMTFSDQGGTPVPFGGCSFNSNEVANSVCHHVAQGVLGWGGNVHDNKFYGFTNACCVAPYTNGIHTNVIEQTYTGTGIFYNNLIHDNSAAVTMLVGCTASIYNNVLWNNYQDIVIDTDSVTCPNPSTDTAYVYNNTVDCSNGFNCFKVGYRGVTLGTLNLKNNHWITNGTAVCYNNTGAGCSNVTAVNASNNLTMTTATAASQGYTSANLYEPTASTNATVDAAVSLSGLCSGNLGSLCADRLHYTRGTSWDTGAYEFGGQSSSTPNAPLSLTAMVQ